VSAWLIEYIEYIWDRTGDLKFARLFHICVMAAYLQ